MVFDPVIDQCEFGGHHFAKLPNHPMRDGRPRCPYCMAIGIDDLRSGAKVMLPVSDDMAEAMVRLGLHYLKSHAPDRIKAVEIQPRQLVWEEENFSRVVSFKAEKYQIDWTQGRCDLYFDGSFVDSFPRLPEAKARAQAHVLERIGELSE